MTIVRRIILGYLGLIVFGLALAGVGLGSTLFFQAGFQEYTASTTEQIASAYQIIDAESSMGVYALLAIGDQNGRSAFTAQMDTVYASAKEMLDVAESLDAGDETQTAAVEHIRATLDQYYQAAGAAIALAATDQAQAVATFSQDALPLAQQIEDDATAYLQQEEALQATLHDHVDGIATTMLIVLIALVVVGIGCALSLAFFISRSIGRQLRSATRSLSSSASELLAVAAQVAAGAAQTATSSNETTVTVEEVKQTAQLAHEKAAGVADSAQELAQLAEEGRGSVEATVGGIERMRVEIGVVAETINRLSDQTSAIGDIITTVSDLADQSNLLSVNASIEAAKAGEHGKGFTVVAQEVKSLAEQSKQAVTQVRTILSEIQKASSRAVEAAEQSQEAIEAARLQSLTTGEAAQSVAETADEAAQAAVQISASSRQQLAGMEQISQAIDNISQAATQSVSGTRQVEQEVKQLQELAGRLRRLVESEATA